MAAAAGEPNDPYLIYTAELMNAIGAEPNDWDKHFKLMADIDLSGYTGKSFNIIGYYRTWQDRKPFTGVFDGNGKKISNFSYTSTDANEIGLFGYVRGVIKDLGLIAPNVDAGTGSGVGSLVDYLDEGTVTGCYAQGGSVSGNNRVGGLAGYNYGTITNSYSTGTVSGTDWDVGGLVGWNDGSITASYSTGTVTGNGDVGGLVGFFYEGIITMSYSTGAVTGVDCVGGLVGVCWGTISNSYANGSVDGDGPVGGLVGYNSLGGTITNCYSTGSVSGTDHSVGGLVGAFNWGATITNCYSTGSVLGNWDVGGLVGALYYGTITNCYATGSVTGTTNVGGLIGSKSEYGYGTPTVTDSFWDIETSGQSISAGGTGKTTAEMKIASTFLEAGWDFIDETTNGTEDIWWILEGQSYPRLWRETFSELEN